MKLLFWQGNEGIIHLYNTSDVVKSRVDRLLTKLYIDLHGYHFESKTWTKAVREGMDLTEIITLFAVKMQDGEPPDVRGFVMTNLENPFYAHIEFLCAMVEKEGVGSFLLKNLVEIMREKPHRLVVVNFRSEISAFYRKCNFLPPDQVTLAPDELEDIKAYRCSGHCELGVVILRLEKQVVPVAKKRRVMLASVAESQRQSASEDGSAQQHAAALAPTAR
jgi:hypothetical protein